MLAQLALDFPKDLRVIYRHNPLIGVPDQQPYPFHDKAALSAQAAEAAGKQGKFWQMHDLLFQRQLDWTGMTPDQFQEWLIARAEELGLDVPKFTADLTDPVNVARIQKIWDDNLKMGLVFTPLLLVNGDIWPDKVSKNYANISSVLKLTLLEKRQFTTCPAMAIDPTKEYIATLTTVKGDILLQLFPDKAPLAVNSFVFLARNGWFDGVTFHRVIPGFVAQAGDPSGTGFGGPGYTFINEIATDLKFDREGLVAMANSGPDTNGSQFFITLGAASHLDGSYTIFGQVISGMEVAKNLTARDPSAAADLPPGDEILTITIDEK